MDFRKILKEITPPFIMKKVNEYRGGKTKDDCLYTCPVCANSFSSFYRIPIFYDDLLDKYEYIHTPYCFETLNRLHYSCPKCGASDRNRLYYMYLQEKFSILKETSKQYSFLDVAPDKSLASYVKSQNFINYRSVDMYMDGVDDKADLTNLDIYKDNQFDILLCSHVLEHIENDRQAMSELYRVMNKGGFGIIMVPILLTLDHDLENPAYDTEALRWKYFGQGDHVRMYSKSGFVDKLTQVGFKVNQLDINHWGEDVFLKNGIHPRSVLYVVEK